MPADQGPGFIGSDPVLPVEIEHKVDEIIIEGEIVESYNFIDYWFEDPQGRARARVYLDNPLEATIYPPIAPGKAPALDVDWSTRDAMISYLARRFLVVKALGPEGLNAIWMAAHALRAYSHRGLSLDD